MSIKPLDLSTLIRHAFFSGAGYGEFEKISEEDSRRWVEYDPTTLAASQRVNAACGLANRTQELENALRPFAIVADLEHQAPPCESVMVNVDHCRNARDLIGDSQ